MAVEPTDRLDAFLERLDRMSLADLGVLALPDPDPDERRALVERVDRAAAAASPPRTAAVAAARSTVRGALLRRFSGAGLQPTFAGLNWTSHQRVVDRARLIAAAEDAAVAALLEDVLDSEDAAALREPFEIAASMPGTATTGVPDLGGARAPAAIAVGTIAMGAGTLGAIVAAAASIRRRLRARGGSDG